MNEESRCIVGGDQHARCAHRVDEADPTVLYVSNNMGEEKKDGEEAGETTAENETEEISKKDMEIRRPIEEKKHTQRRETTTERSEQVHKKCIRDKKRMKRQQDIQRILEDFKRVRNIPGLKSAKKKVLITKIKNEKGEIITSRKGIANVLENSTENYTTTMSKTNLNKKLVKTKMKAALMCTTTAPMR